MAESKTTESVQLDSVEPVVQHQSLLKGSTIWEDYIKGFTVCDSLKTGYGEITQELMADLFCDHSHG